MPRWFSCQQTVTHPSSNLGLVSIADVDPSQPANHYTTPSTDINARQSSITLPSSYIGTAQDSSLHHLLSLSLTLYSACAMTLVILIFEQ